MSRANRAGRKHSRLVRDSCGVSDVLGSILLVGITVVTAGAFGAILLSFEGPVERPETNLTLSITPGTGSWGTGDERIVIRHLGGDELRANELVVRYAINGGATQTVTGAALGLTNGKLVIGQAWMSPALTLQSVDNVALTVVHSGNANFVLAAATVIPAQITAGAACPFDTTIPSVQWQAPVPNANTAFSGAFTLTAKLTDDCAGVNPATIPKLNWAIVSGGPSGQIDMTSLGNDLWRATIPTPSGGWALQGFRTLQYSMSPIADARGNSGSSATVNDLIELSGAQVRFVNTAQAIAPTPALVNPGNLQAQDGAVTTLTEGGGGCTGGTITLATSGATDVSQAGSSGNNPQDATTSNDGWRHESDSPPVAMRFGFPNPTPGCEITQVRIRIEQSIQRYSNDGWTVQACGVGGLNCGTVSAFQASGVTQGSSNPTDVVLTFDVTSLPPAAGWSWTSINDLEVNIIPTQQGSKDNNGGTSRWRLDFLELLVTSAPAYTGTAQLDWTGLPSGTAYYLEIGYTGSDESFNVNVWNGASYTTRGTLTAGAAPGTIFFYALAPSEVIGNAVRVRIVDSNPADTAIVSSQAMDFARVSIA